MTNEDVVSGLEEKGFCPHNKEEGECEECLKVTMSRITEARLAEASRLAKEEDVPF